MSFRKCEKCGEVIDENEGHQCGEGKKKITVDVKMTSEMKAALEENTLLRQKLADKEELFRNLALETFESEKDQLRKEFPDKADAIDTVGTPEQLEGLRRSLEAHKKVPDGKAPFTAPTDAETFKDKVAMVDELYDRAYYHKENYSPEQVKDAKQKIEALITTMVNGESWGELKKSKTLKEIAQSELGQCPECHFTLVNTNKCPNCGYDPTEKKRVAKTRFGAPEDAYKAPRVT